MTDDPTVPDPYVHGQHPTTPHPQGNQGAPQGWGPGAQQPAPQAWGPPAQQPAPQAWGPPAQQPTPQAWGPPAPQPAPQGWGPGPVPPPPAARRSRKGLVVGGAVVGSLVLVGGAGAMAFSALSGGGSQPEDALPATAIGYLRVDLDPSASQKINLLRLADRMPDLASDLDVELDEDTDLKQLIAEAVTKSGECEIDYAADVEPWIGDRAAVAALPGVDDDEPSPVVVVAVTDEAAARAALESGLGCGEGLEAAQVAFTAGFAVVTGEGVAASDVVAATADAPLAEDATFAADMDALGDPGLVSFWADTAAFTESLGESSEELLGSGATGATGLEDYTSVTGALRAAPDGIELTVLSAADDEVLAPYRTGGRAATVDLPTTTLAAASFSVDPDAVDTMWDQLGELYDTTEGMAGGLGDGSPTVYDTSTASVATASATLPAAVEPVDPEDPAVQEQYEYCLDAAEDMGLTGDDLDEMETSFLESFMDGCTGAGSHPGPEEPMVEDPWGDTGSTETPSFDDVVALLADELDIHLPDDLRTLLGEQVVVAVDAEGLDDLESIAEPGDVDAGLRTVGDPDALADLAERVDAAVVDAGGEPLATAPAEDGFVVATNDDYAATLAAGGDLGDSDVYRSVVTDEDASSVLFVDLDRLTEVLRPVLEEDGAEALPYLEPLRAVGMTSGADDTHATFTLRVSFD